MWEEDDEDDIIAPGTPRADNVIESFLDWERGVSRYFGENELEFLFRHFHYYSPDNEYRVRKVLEMGLDMFPNSGIFQICQARFLMDKGLLEEAISSLRNAKVLDPMNPEIAVLLSECLEEKEEYTEALNILVEVEDASSEFNMDVAVRLASLLFHFERRTEALERVASIIKEECDLNGNDTTVSVAAFTFDTEDVLEAVDLLLDEDPFNSSYWFFKGHCSMLIEKWDASINSFEYAHYLNEKDATSLFFLGLCHKEKKEYNLAKKYFSEASEAGYNKEECIIETAICLNHLEDFAQARFLLQNLVTENEENQAEIYYEIGFSYVGEDNPYKALPYLEKSAALSPSLFTYSLMGEIYVQLCETENLIEVYQKAKEVRLMDSEFFTARFFSLFYREELFDYMNEVMEADRQENGADPHSLFQMVMNALKQKALGKTNDYLQGLINCFSLNTEETVRYIKKIDPVLLQHPDIISIKELF